MQKESSQAWMGTLGFLTVKWAIPIAENSGHIRSGSLIRFQRASHFARWSWNMSPPPTHTHRLRQWL